MNNLFPNTASNNHTSKRKMHWLKFSSYSYFLASVYGLGVLQAILGFQQPLFNTVFVFAILSFILLSSVKDGIKILPMIIVYLGYSYVEMQIITGTLINNTTFTNIVILVLALKAILFAPGAILKKKYIVFLILGCYIMVQRLFYNEISSSLISLLTIIVVIIYLERICKIEIEIQAFIRLFIITIASTYLYSFLHRDFIIWNLSKDTLRETWRGFQFYGMRDPNNTALHANFCLAYILLKDVFHNKKEKLCMSVFLVFTSIITISLSGILTTIALLGINCLKDVKKITILVVVVVCLYIASINSQKIINMFMNTEIGFVQSIGYRMNDVITFYKVKDYYRLTSTRTDLWSYYMVQYESQNTVKKLFGNPLINLQRTGQASHNGWIDFLLDNGLIGLITFLGVICINCYRVFRVDGVSSLLLLILFGANIFARSLDYIFIYLLIFTIGRRLVNDIDLS